MGAASSAPTLGEIMRAFKSISAIAANRVLGLSGIPFWQRNYYEHIVRNDHDLDEIREYVMGNSLNWEKDENNPQPRQPDHATLGTASSAPTVTLER